MVTLSPPLVVIAGLSVTAIAFLALLSGVEARSGVSACIPSKALLHVAAVMDEVSYMADLGVDYCSKFIGPEQ